MPEAPSLRNRISLSALWACLLSCGLTVLVLSAVYALRGIWPFGPDNVAYVDTAQFSVPSYYALWDAMHGASRHVNWFAGLAEGASAGVWDFLNPPNYVFLFLPRDRILEGLSLYLAVYLCEIALIAGLTVSLRFPRLPILWRVLLSLGYTFSGYVLQYYANFSWLWVAAFFPLLLYSLERLLRQGRYVLYTLMYAYTLFSSIYFTYMVTVYILLFSLGYVLFLLPRDKRGDRLFRLGASTAAAYGLTAYWWVWSSTALTNRSRFQSNLDSGLMAGVTTWDITNTRHTVLMLLGMALTAALLLRALRRQRSLDAETGAGRARVIRFFLFLCGMLAVPMVFTNIDAAWHFGQYSFFPMRYGFALPATLLGAAGLCLEEELSAPETLPEPGRGRTALRAGAAVLIGAALLFLEPKLSAYFREYGACFLNALGAGEYWGRYFPLLLACGALFTGLYLLLLGMKRRKAAAWLIAGVFLLQLGTNACGLIAPSDDHTYTREYDPAYIETADALHEVFAGQGISPLSRAKNVDNSLNAGYPSIAGISAVSSVNDANSSLRLGIFRELGYTVNYFRVLDTGGTVFSDMLLGVDTILSAEPMDESLYSDTGTEIAGIRIGAAKYPGAVGLTYPEGALDGYLDILDMPGRLNALYRAFTGSDASLAFPPETELTAEGDGLRVYTLTCRLPEEAFLYMSADGAILNITAEGKAVPVPSYQNTGNTVYPAPFNSNLLYLGRFPAGTVTVRFTSGAELSVDDLPVTALSRRLVESFRADGGLASVTGVQAVGDDGFALTVTADNPGERLFLPLIYSSHWHCSVNGRPVPTERVLGMFLSLPLEAGENAVTVERGPNPLRITGSMLLSLAFLALGAAWLWLRRQRAPLTTAALPAWADVLTRILFYGVCAAMIALLYIAPAVLFFVRGTIVRF